MISRLVMSVYFLTPKPLLMVHKVKLDIVVLFFSQRFKNFE